jgi:hypothetical protein
MKSVTVAAVATLGLAAAPAAALVTFGSSSIVTTPNIRYVNSGSPANSLLYTTNGAVNPAGSALSVFSVSNAVSGFLPLAATLTNFTLNATVPTITGLSSGDAFSVSGVNGSFSFIALNPVTVGTVTGVNILTAVFTNATLSGTIGGSSMTLAGNSGTGGVTYTSDFLDFSLVNSMAFSLTGNTQNPITTATGGRIANYRASLNGNFASNPPPTLPRVPEPETWAMLVLGFGLVGVTLRRRKNFVVA